MARDTLPTGYDQREIKPYNVLKLEFSSGDKYYSDRNFGTGDASSIANAQARVKSWGNVNSLTREAAVNPVGDLSIVLNDTDGAIKNIIDSEVVYRKRATLYQLVEGDATPCPVLIGVINAPVRWNEDVREVHLDITDISILFETEVGYVADREDLPNLAKQDEGQTLPIVYGKVKRVKGVLIKTGARTELAADLLGAEDNAVVTHFIVSDASDFPQNQVIDVQIENEIIRGYFTGNTFKINQRAVGIINSHVSAAATDGAHIIDFSLPDVGENYFCAHGYFVYAEPPGCADSFAYRYRAIQKYASAERVLTLNTPFYECVNGTNEWILPPGTPYKIKTLPALHYTGAEVQELVDGFVYVVNDRASLAVHKVEVWGKKSASTSAGEVLTSEVEGWVEVDPTWYEVNLDDTTTLPGHHLTTITFFRLPKDLSENFLSNEIYADVSGVYEDSSLVTNPSAVIKKILKDDLGLTDDDLDLDSFSDAQTRLDDFEFAFALNEKRRGLDLCADLAFQARCCLLWEGGKARLQYLENKAGMSQLTINNLNIRRDTLTIQQTPLTEVVSELTARYKEGGQDRSLTLIDADAETTYGRRTKEIELWAYSQRRFVNKIAAFWLSRWKYVHSEIRFRTFLAALKLERLDYVTLDFAEIPAGTKAYVVEIDHTPGAARDARMDEVEIEVRTHSSFGCDTSCEASCETTGCETTCEANNCQTGCETGCEIQCESTCEDACEIGCQSACQLDCMVGCQLFCQTTCMVTCETAGCESGCEGSCTAGAAETGCDVVCEAGACMEGCETGCESTCEPTCQTGCEVGCQTGCESGCEASCQTGCQGSCESICQAGCEAGCETGCQTGCQGECQTGCMSGCEQGCMTGCEVSCESQCEEPWCQTGCQIACETGCTSDCQIPVETSCFESCETGCETGCEVACEVGCETHCESLCETTCQTTCEAGCEVLCETGCETSCETGCQVSCETGCETGGEAADECCCQNGDVSEGVACCDFHIVPGSCPDDLYRGCSATVNGCGYAAGSCVSDRCYGYSGECHYTKVGNSGDGGCDSGRCPYYFVDSTCASP